MTGEELVQRVQQIILDSSFTEDNILSILNEGLLHVAGEFRLPGLFTNDTVATIPGSSSVILPDDFHKDVVRVYSDTQTKLIGDNAVLLKEWRRFSRKYPGMSSVGPVVDVAVVGNYIHYMPMPSTAETLRVFYYRLPDTLTDSVEPDGIPVQLHGPLLVSYACHEIFGMIEDGVAGEGYNTAKYRGRYEEALDRLRAFLGPDDDMPDYIHDDIGSYDCPHPEELNYGPW